jgi:hypothetical protein
MPDKRVKYLFGGGDDCVQLSCTLREHNHVTFTAQCFQRVSLGHSGSRLAPSVNKGSE